MNVDIAYLRALLASVHERISAPSPLPWSVCAASDDDGDSFRDRVLDAAGAFVAEAHWDAALIAAAVNALPALLDRIEAAERDAVPVREGWWDKAIAERDELRARVEAAEAEVARLRAEPVRMQADDTQAAISALCWFLRWVLDEDERRWFEAELDRLHRRIGDMT